MKASFLIVLVFLLSIQVFAQADSTQESRSSLGLEMGGKVYTNDVLAIYSGVQLQRPNKFQIILGPLFYTDEDVLRLGANLALRFEVIEPYGVFYEMGMQYFELKSNTGHFEKSTVASHSFGLKTRGKISTLLQFGIGYDPSKVFAKSEFGLVGFVKLTWSFGGLYVLK